jgi:hypothetical protein
MNDNTNTAFTSDILLSDDKMLWRRTRRNIKREGPSFPLNEDIELWLKHNAPLTLPELADIRYSLYHHCSRACFTVTGVTEDEFELIGRHSTLRLISDSARRYLLWRLRLLGKSKNWIGAIPLTKNAKTQEKQTEIPPCRQPSC